MSQSVDETWADTVEGENKQWVSGQRMKRRIGSGIGIAVQDGAGGGNGGHTQNP